LPHGRTSAGRSFLPKLDFDQKRKKLKIHNEKWQKIDKNKMFYLLLGRGEIREVFPKIVRLKLKVLKQSKNKIMLRIFDLCEFFMVFTWCKFWNFIFHSFWKFSVLLFCWSSYQMLQ